mmetsp:Transcript_119400/g.385498  ORF Transcript_119400/g.385498 Transcript_119400/m.385498 type:complete len:287 (-) Transcript_119400:251-1111(-)
MGAQGHGVEVRVEAEQGVVPVAAPHELHEVGPAGRRNALSEAPAAGGLDLVVVDALEDPHLHLFRDVLALVDAPVVAQEVLQGHAPLQLRVVLVGVQHDDAERKGVRSVRMLQVPSTLCTRVLAVLHVLPVVGVGEDLQHPVDLLRLLGEEEGLQEPPEGLINVRRAPVKGVHEGCEGVFRLRSGLPEKLAHGRVGHAVVQAPQDPPQLLGPLLEGRRARVARRQGRQSQEPGLLQHGPALLGLLLQLRHEVLHGLAVAPLLLDACKLHRVWAALGAGARAAAAEG